VISRVLQVCSIRRPLASTHQPTEFCTQSPRTFGHARLVDRFWIQDGLHRILVRVPGGCGGAVREVACEGMLRTRSYEPNTAYKGICVLPFFDYRRQDTTLNGVPLMASLS
jgi:hypothetical protein